MQIVFDAILRGVSRNYTLSGRNKNKSQSPRTEGRTSCFRQICLVSIS